MLWLSSPVKATPAEIGTIFFRAVYEKAQKLSQELARMPSVECLPQNAGASQQALFEMCVLCLFPFHLIIRHEFPDHAAQIEEALKRMVAEHFADGATARSALLQSVETRFVEYGMALGNPDRGRAVMHLGALALLRIFGIKESADFQAMRICSLTVAASLTEYRGIGDRYHVVAE